MILVTGAIGNAGKELVRTLVSAGEEVCALIRRGADRTRLPADVLALIGTVAVVPTSRDPEHATIDPAGAVLSVTGISGVVFAIIEGPALGWAFPTVVAAFVVGVLALVAFVLWELRSKRPMLDPRLFLVRPSPPEPSR